MSIGLTATGLELEAPSAGDIVTVRVRPPRHYKLGMPPPLRMGERAEYWEFESPQHYRHTEIWRVIAVNGGSAVVEAYNPIYEHRKGRETWPIHAHLWFDASELAKAWDGEE